MLCKPKGIKALMAENLILRKQLMTLSRKYKHSPKLSFFDRLSFAVLSQFINRFRLNKLAIIVKPATIIQFHKALIKRKYHLLFSTKSIRKPGPKGPSKELIELILEMKRRNPRYGYLRIAMQIQNVFDLTINKDIVRRVLNKFHHRNPNNHGPSWLSFLANMKDSLWSVDFFRCESILMKSHWVMVIMDQFTRQIIGFATRQGNLNGIDICCMFNNIISGNNLPKKLSSDNDPLFQYYRWKANLRILDIKEIKTLPCVPLSHPFVERLIKSIRNELLDQILFWNSNDLQRKLDSYKQYFNQYRSHSSLDFLTPNQKMGNIRHKSIRIEKYRWELFCRGLFQLAIVA